MAFIDRFSHLNGIIQSAIRAPNVEQLNEWLSFQDSSWEVLPMTGADDFRDNLAFEPFDYLYNTSDQSIQLKPAGVWLSSAGSTVDPALTTNMSWTVTGTLASDFSQPTSTNASIYRFVDTSTGQRVGSSAPLDNGIGTLVSSGTLSSGIANQITFNPNTIPGIYRFFIENNHRLWRATDFDLTVSGATNSPVMSGTQVGTWNLQINEDVSPDTWTITRGTSQEYTANNNLFGLDLESGEIVLSSGGRIVTKNKFGTEVFVDLLAADNSIDFQTIGANSSINIAARGEDSAVNILAESGTVNIDAIISDVTIDAIGDNRIINIAAGGEDAGVLVQATGINSYIQLETIGAGSSIQLEANRASSFITLSATAADSTILLQGENINVNPESTFTFDGNQPGNPTVQFKAGAGNINFLEGVSGGRVEFNTGLRTRFIGILDAEDSDQSLRLPQRSNAQLNGENPGAAGKGRIAWDTSDDRLEFWDGATWQQVASGTGTGLTEIVQDTSPELGGALDCGFFFVTNAGRFRTGSSGFPSSAAYSFDSDTNTGMYRKQDGVIAFTGNNSEILTVSGVSTNTAGIGINGHVTATGTIFSQDLDVADTGTFRDSLLLFNNADADADFTIDSGASATQQSRIFLNDQQTPKWILYKTSANNFAVFDFAQSHNVIVANSHADNADAITIDNGAVAIASTLTAPTGTFANSLTISGVAVATVGVGATAGSIKLITETFAL